MKCPKCGHDSGKALLKCSECLRYFDRQSLEKYEHLAFLQNWLEEQSALLDTAVLEQLGEVVEREQRWLELALGIAAREIAPPESAETLPSKSEEPIAERVETAVPVAPSRPAMSLGREVLLLRAAIKMVYTWPASMTVARMKLLNPMDADLQRLQKEMGDRSFAEKKPSELDVLTFTSERLEDWAARGQLTLGEVDAIRDYLAEKRSAVGQRKVEADQTPLFEAVPLREVEPSTPFTQVIRELVGKGWSGTKKRIGDAAASGMLLNALLYLGAFMVVISAGILVVRFWDSFPPAAQLGVIAAVPATFYLLGWLGLAKLKLPNAGRVLTYIGALLVAVDFAAIYQFGGLAGEIDFNLFWLIASLVCTVIYALTAWRLPTEFTGYLVLVGMTNVLVSLSALLGLDRRWQITAVALAAIIMLGLAWGLERQAQRWHKLSRAARRLPLFLLPAAQIGVLFVPGESAWGQMATFALAAVGYGLLSWLFASRERWRAIYAHAAVWSSLGALIFAVLALQLPSIWYGATAAVFSGVYILIGQQLARRMPEELSGRKWYLASIYEVGFGLLSLAVLLGLAAVIQEQFDASMRFWTGVAALTLAAVVLVGCAALFGNVWFLLAGSGFIILPFSLSISRWLLNEGTPQWIAWLMLSWTSMALLYTMLARFLPLPTQYGMTLNLWAQALTAASFVGLWFNYDLAAEVWLVWPTLIVLASAFLVYLVCALIHDGEGHPALSNLVNWLPEPVCSSVFIWPLALLLPLWTAVAWLDSSLPLAWLGPVLAGTALVYVGLGQLIYRWRSTYRLPLHVFAYILALIGIGLALTFSWPLLITLVITVATAAVLAAIYQRTLELAAAAALFVWPFHLALMLSPISVYAYALAYVLLVCLVYIPLGQIFHPSGYRIPWRFDPAQAPKARELPRAMVFYLTGYILAAGAVIVALRDSLVYPTAAIPWIGALVPALVCGLAVFNLYRWREKVFAWTAVCLLAVSYGMALTWLRVPQSFYAAAWIALALVCMLAERVLAHWKADSWLASLRWPLGIGTIVLCALGLSLTAQDTVQVFSGRPIEVYGPIIAAQGLAVLLTMLAAPLYRSKWPLYLEPALSFIAVTLFFAGYGRQLLGQPLSSEAFGLIWIGLALLHLITAALLDGLSVRYAQGLYLGGYVLTIIALAQSAADPPINIVVLGLTILIAAGSQVLVHFGRHRTYEAFARLIWHRPGTIAWRTARIFFLFYAAYAFPIWLARLLSYFDVSQAWLGTAFALTAPLFVALGLLLRRLKREYTWPLYSAGYALTAVGALITVNDQRLFIAVLSLNAVVYAASAVIFKQSFWLYLSNALLPVIALLVLHYNGQLKASWIAWIFMGLAYLYVAVGWLLNKRLAKEGHISPFALPFYGLGYLLSAVALAAGSSERMLAIGVFSAGVLLYGFSAWLLQEHLFVYPAAWLAAVPYILLMTLTPLPREWYGLGLLPLVLLYIGIGRFIFRGYDLGIHNLRSLVSLLDRPCLPFYLLAYVFSVGMVIVSWPDMLPLTLALAAAAAVYCASAALFGQFLWLYPGLLAAHMAVLTTMRIEPSGRPYAYASLPFVFVMWLLVILGLGFTRYPAAKTINVDRREFTILNRHFVFGGWPCIAQLLTPSWSQPFFIFAALDVIVWQIVALGGYDTALVLAISNLLLLGFLATLWQDGALAYGSLGFLAFAAATVLRWAALPVAQILALMGGVGLAFYGTALLVGLFGKRRPQSRVWIRPLERTAVALSIVAVLGTLPTVVDQPLATSGALGFAGALYLAKAYRQRNRELGYFAVGLLEIAWLVLLIGQAIGQPQLYALPVGLYLVGMGAMERRRERYRIANILEASGLTIILLTSLIQSLHIQGGFPYFVLLVVESLLALAWGAWCKAKVPFFMGLGSSFVNVIAQLVLVATVNDIWRWVIILGTGMLVIGLAILYERQRERLTLQIQEWQVELESWS